MRFRAINVVLASLSLLAANSIAASVLSAELTGTVDKVVDGDTF